jgi:hypothetical protein
MEGGLRKDAYDGMKKRVGRGQKRASDAHDRLANFVWKGTEADVGCIQ